MASFVAGFTKLLTYIEKHHKDEQKPELVPQKENSFLICCGSLRRKRKGRLKHEDIYQAETEVFGPLEAGYQVQFLRLAKATSESKEAGLTVPNRLLAFENGRGNFNENSRKSHSS
jgi:hypothetical protein